MFILWNVELGGRNPWPNINVADEKSGGQMPELMRWRMIAGMTALFIAGVMTGVAVAARTSAGSQTLKLDRSNEIGALLRQKLQVLDLSPVQRQKLEPLITETSEEIEASHLQCLQNVSAAIDNLNAQIRPELSLEQQETLKRLDAERSAVLRQKYNYDIETAQAGHY
jgi:hypothetical protein